MSNISGHGPYSWEHGVRRFWERTNVARDECWPWMGCIGSCGYGQLDINFRRYLTHRFSYMLHNGNEEIPDGMCVCHTCDNPPCVNPDHLFLGTKKDNIHDMIVKGRDTARHRGSGRALLTSSDVKSIKEDLSQGGRGTITTLARRYEVSRGAISGIKFGKTWNQIK